MLDKVQSKLYFQGKQIIALEGKTSKEYELLMRRDIDGVARFPYQEFITTMTHHDQHKQYVTELEVILTKVLSHNPNYTFSFNLDYQELFYEETFTLFEQIDPALRSRLKLELTERLPLNRTNAYDEFLPKVQLERLAALGYQLVLDDFLAGVNSLAGLFEVPHLISRIKISVLHLKRFLPLDTIIDIINVIVTAIDDMALEVVIEGVEDSDLIKDLPTSWRQQSFYYSSPVNVEPITF